MIEARKISRAKCLGQKLQSGVFQAVQVVFVLVWAALLVSALVSIQVVYPINPLWQNVLSGLFLAALLGTGALAAWMLGRAPQFTQQVTT